MSGPTTFDWSPLEVLLTDTASRKKHAAFSFYIDWPGQSSWKLPAYLEPIVNTYPLIDREGKVVGSSVDYGDPDLLTALEAFIAEFGAVYDGDPRIAVVHLGLLGFWGEWHVFPHDEEDMVENGPELPDIVPEVARRTVAQSFRDAFPQTQVQARYPGPNTAGFGYYDGSFTHNTIDGVYNNNTFHSWYFLPQLMAAGDQNVWQTNMIAGETFPALQKKVFTTEYSGGTTDGEQDFLECVRQTHASWILHHDAFGDDAPYRDANLANALEAHAVLGYSFVVTDVRLLYDEPEISVGVSLEQIGVAPFYYDLSLEVDCYDLTEPLSASNVQKDLVSEGDTQTYLLPGLPATTQCLQAVSVQLVSSMQYPGTRIKFAQGTDGSMLLRDLPLPPGLSPTPTVPILPTVAPTLIPTMSPPTAAPVAPYEVLYYIRGEDQTDEVNTPHFEVSTDGVYCDGSKTVQGVGEYNENDFKCHHWGSGTMRYTIKGLNPAGIYPLRLGFAEIFEGNCITGARLFSVKVNNAPFVSALDVYTAAGCLTAHFETRYVSANDDGLLEIDFQGIRENPYVSLLEVGQEHELDSPLASGEPSREPSNYPSPEPSNYPSPEPSTTIVSSSANRVPSPAPSSSPAIDGTGRNGGMKKKTGSSKSLKKGGMMKKKKDSSKSMKKDMIERSKVKKRKMTLMKKAMESSSRKNMAKKIEKNFERGMSSKLQRSQDSNKEDSPSSVAPMASAIATPTQSPAA